MFRSVKTAFKRVRIKNVELSVHNNSTCFCLVLFHGELTLMTTEYRD